MKLIIYQVGGGMLAEREADHRPRRGDTLDIGGRPFVVSAASWTGKGDAHAIYVNAPPATTASENTEAGAVSSFDAALRAMMKG